MRATAETLRAQLQAFDASEIRRRIEKAQLRLKAEDLLPGIRERYDLDVDTSVHILTVAVDCGVDDDEVAFALNGIAATVAGESVAWLDAAKRVDNLRGTTAILLGPVLTAMGSALGQAVSSGVLSQPK